MPMRLRQEIQKVPRCGIDNPLRLAGVGSKQNRLTANRKTDRARGQSPLTGLRDGGLHDKRAETPWTTAAGLQCSALLAVCGLQPWPCRNPFRSVLDWMLFTVVGVLMIPTVWARQRGLDNLTKILGYTLTSIVTLDMVVSLGLLVAALPSHKESPLDLLRSASALWITNILVFASWYWRLDAGGPHARELRGVHTDGAFLFPQMTLNHQAKAEMQEESWSPGFVDYLFLAFNTSTAFSPTDSPVLSSWAKILMMIQALISFATVALLAARAVNIL